MIFILNYHWNHTLFEFGMIPVVIWYEYHTSVFAVYNCAASYKTGWWYRFNCHHNDINRQPPYVGGYSVLFTEMKIRPKDCIFTQ